MPPILANSLLLAPATVANFFPEESKFAFIFNGIRENLVYGGLLWNILLALLIVYMAYFYAPIQFKTKKIAESLQKNNAFVPGYRPGAKTQEFLDFILNRLTFVGSIFLIIICVIPTVFGKMINVHSRLNGTAMLILVSVSIRVMMNIQAFLYADRYESAYKVKGKYSGPRRRF